MRIDGTIPMHIAKAYGVPHAAKVAKPAASAATPQANVIGKIEPKAPHVSRASDLVAAHVNQPIDFNRIAMPATPSPSGAHQLYTRAADRIEAAIGVEVGRQIDVRG